MRDNAKTISMPITRYAVRPANIVRDREIVLGLWQQGFPAPDQQRIKYDWCYGPTPVGVGRLYLLEHGANAEVIGVQGIVPRHWWYQGKTRGVGICADLVVDKNHRSIGPALNMVRQVIEIEQDLPAAELLYGFPNPKSEALYRRAGYTKWGEITRYARPLRLHFWLARKAIPDLLARVLGKINDIAFQLRLKLSNMHASQHWCCVPANVFDKRFDVLWSRVSKQAGPMVIRDSEFLQWRFGNNFSGQTQVMVLEARDGQIDGYVVYVVNGDNMVSILDFLTVDNDKTLPAMLKMFLRAMYDKGHVGAMLEFAGPKPISDILVRCGFLPRESSPVYVVLGKTQSELEQGGLPYFTGCDRDQ